MQRLFDILFSGVALIILAPIFLVLMLVLKMSGEGEIFFLQERIGRDGKRIKLFKFATMLKNSEYIGTGTVTLYKDPRILPIGGLLRKTKINELPQLLNIFKGDMSVIGPRPQAQRCFDAFPEKSKAVIVQVRPGLSGVGSIIFRDEEKMMDDHGNADYFYDEVIMPYKAKLEEWYVGNSSLYVYFGLIVLTMWVLILPKSEIIWKLFKSLPKPPQDLSKVL
ncbi:sugar transferase [Amylibacter sp.]|jgi:lipopolysaccharide/colanic/teichoic acid biosynthesis glycosyltransferase|nr:sugar transferase [Amylibacter sp.]